MIQQNIVVVLAALSSLCAVLGFLWKIASCVTSIRKDINTNTAILESRGKQFDTFETSLSSTLRTQEEIVSKLKELQDTTLRILYVNTVEIVLRTPCGSVIKVPMTKVTTKTQEGYTHAGKRQEA